MIVIYLMRHGEIQTGGEKRYVGQTDIPLSERGIAAAKRWHDELLSVKFSRIICSDLSRTRDTCRIIAGKRTLPFEEIRAFREIDLGEWDGRAMAEIKADYPQEWIERGNNIAVFRPPGGESFVDLQERTFPVFDDIARQSRQNVLITAHAGVNRVLLCRVLGISLEKLFMIEQDYSCLNLLRFNRPWKVTAINSLMSNSKLSRQRI